MVARRRLALLAFMVSVVGGSVLAAPAVVWAGATFSRSVTFPPEVETGWTQLFNLSPGICSSGTPAAVGPPGPGALEGPADTTPQVRTFSGMTGTGTYCLIDNGGMGSVKYAFTTQDRDTSNTSSGVRYNDTQWAGSLRLQAVYGPDTATGQRRINVSWYTCSWFVSGGPTCGFGGGDILRTDNLCLSPVGISATSTSCDVVLPAPPAGARAFSLGTSTTGGASNTINLTEMILTVEPTDHVLGGDCIGTGGLAWGASGLTSTTHSEWGDGYLSAYRGCRFDRIGFFEYDPPEGLDAGDTFGFGVQVASTSGGNCRTSAQWVLASSTVPLMAVHDYSGSNVDGALGPGAFLVHEDVPTGALSIRVSFSARCILQSVYVANVEGDPVLDVPCTDDDPCIQPNPDGSDPGNIFEDCDAPGNPLDVPGWLSFGACVVVAGFTNTLSAIWSIPGAVVNGDLGDLSGVLDPLSGIMEFLFVPDGFDDTMDGLLTAADDKIPFVWIGEVADVLGDMTSGVAMAGDPIDFDMTLMGAPVSIDPTSVTDPVEQFRPVLVGMVAFGLAWAVLGQIGGALGMHRPSEEE